ncbi:MAG: AAA family ATPase [Bacteroidaceae bacterium]|nr:AAA family ATPase [Bacteroidaceae bacterium]
MKTKGNKKIVLDEYQRKVLAYVASGESLFITGKAGTGKTSLLREIKKMYAGKKVVAVLAPTGVAARNAEGYTMHSFLRLPLKPYLPEHKVKPDLYQLNNSGAETIRSIDTLIIDEISMVRCDMLDAADAILQHYRHNSRPFGGVQLIMFGDLYQLSPVADSEDKKVLKGGYNANEFYFFLSQALRHFDYRVVELQKIHRQDNRKFINLLNAVRIGEINVESLKMLESRVDKNIKQTPQDGVITLMTHNYQSKNLNRDMYEKLNTKEYLYKAKIVEYTDRWHDKYPVDYKFRLKVGARVMFQRNDNENKKYNNGTMGWVIHLADDCILVETDNGDRVSVKRAVWQQFDYFVDKKTKTIYTQVSAEYHQYPLKLAWAVSIHKSQGLTLKEVNIDASQAFAFGQVYVALSRCETLEGIHLLEMIPSHKIIADDVVRQYMESIDEEGYVTRTDDFNDDNYEVEPLVLSVKSATFNKIISGDKKKHQQLIKDSDSARRLFAHNEDGSVCINNVWVDERKITNYWDMNGNHFPFVFRRYRTVRFVDKIDGRMVDVEVDGAFEPYKGVDAEDYYNWGFKFRFGKIIRRKRK